MIVVKLFGGLGNQLFQLSAGIYLENNVGRKVIYDVSNLTSKPKAEIGNYTRRFEIGELVLDSQTIKSRYPLRADYPVRFIRRILDSNTVIIESDPNFDVLERVDYKTTAVYGYFQNASIVNSAWPVLHSRLQQSSKFASLVNSERVVRIAIHMRFGDYSKDPRTKSVHGLTSAKYFDQAINLVKLNEILDIPILVVTDDKSEASAFLNKFSGSANIQVVSNPDPIDDLNEICKSSHVVITNSTFSWWGGWIADRIHKSRIIYPRPWFADSSDPELPIYVNDWTAIKREFSEI